MNTVLIRWVPLCAAVLLAPGLARAQGGLLDCWYNPQKQYTGADGAQPGEQAGVFTTGHGGDYFYRYTFAGTPGSCPATLPQPQPQSAQGLLDCWYNPQKQYTGADGAQPGEQTGVFTTGHGGDYAYRYTFAGTPGSCPATLPQSGAAPADGYAWSAWHVVKTAANTGSPVQSRKGCIAAPQADGRYQWAVQYRNADKVHAYTVRQELVPRGAGVPADFESGGSTVATVAPGRAGPEQIDGTALLPSSCAAGADLYTTLGPPRR